MLQLPRINAVILDCIGICKKFRMLQAWNGSNHTLLYIPRQTATETIGIYNRPIDILWLKHNMVLICISKPHNFILYRWTIPHTCALYCASI